MGEKRKFNRWETKKEKNAVISCAGVKKEAGILDIGAGGMKISLLNPVEVGTAIEGEFKILPFLGPFFMRGKVIRATEKDGAWEVAIEFDKISTSSLSSDKRD